MRPTATFTATFTFTVPEPRSLCRPTDLDVQLQESAGQAAEARGLLQMTEQRLLSEQQRHGEARLRAQDLQGQVDALAVRAETLQR